MKRFGSRIVEFSVDNPRLVAAVMAAVAAALIVLAAVPSVWPDRFGFLHGVKVDTDPENMLPADEPVRVFHDHMKEQLALHDMVVVGVVNDSHPQGVFNVASLGKIYALTQFALTLQWPDPADPARRVGVVAVDVIAPSTVDNIETEGAGTIRFEWLMPRPPLTEDEALAVRAKAARIPFLQGTLVSEDGKALALYLPLTSKDLSYRVYAALGGRIAELGGPEAFHVTGLPVAEDTFGVEMFQQMAVSAPLAMLVIFILMFVFFRKLILIVSPMIVAMVSVVVTMGLLIVTGQTIHIMSSMIPIFIMPIAVLDAVHILSEFFDRYQETRDRRKTVMRVMETLFTPMLYTSLTTTAGFASLALTPIPPVQVFGLYIALGVMVAWLATVTFIPAFIMFIPTRRLENFGLKKGQEEALSHTPVSRMLRVVGRATYRWAPLVLVLTAAAVALAVYGISLIRINDNPTRWFEPQHPIRVADRVLNAHFGGTYMAYLALESTDPMDVTAETAGALALRAAARGKELAGDFPAAPAAFAALAEEARTAFSEGMPLPDPAADGVRPATRDQWLARLDGFVQKRLDAAKDDEWDAWDQASLFLSAERQRSQVFKDPEALRYVAALQEHLKGLGVVGKSNSLTDIVRTVYRELMEGRPEYFRVPDTAAGVAQCLIQYQSSHRPQDLDHFVTPDYRTTSVWVQLTSGDNRDMQSVVDATTDWTAANPPPAAMDVKWFGMTYINVIWQDKMVSGMLQSFLGSFLVVLLMMIVLFRSSLWGLLSMIPLTVTVGAIYGVVGLVGKDYDMPTAVLSALTLGLAVDYAIHFLARSREARAQAADWKEAVPHVFGEPARAIFRNVIVIGVGFLPLLAAPLVPYQTVGVFMAAILVLAGVASLLILPALIRVLEPLLFPKSRACSLTCNAMTCIVTAATAVALVAVNVHQFLGVGLTWLVWVSLPAVVVLAAGCWLMSYREKCRREREAARQGKGDCGRSSA
jgi:hypothetical protein